MESDSAFMVIQRYQHCFLEWSSLHSPIETFLCRPAFDSLFGQPYTVTFSHLGLANSFGSGVTSISPR